MNILVIVTNKEVNKMQTQNQRQDFTDAPRKIFTVTATIEIAPDADIEDVATQMGYGFEHPDIIWSTLSNLQEKA